MSRGPDPSLEDPRRKLTPEVRQKIVADHEAERERRSREEQAKASEAPEQKHAIDEGDDVWNVTAKAIRMPNGQVIRAHSKGHIHGWGIWMKNDVVKSWLASGALTETDPEELPDEAEQERRPASKPLSSPVHSVFTDKRDNLGRAGGVAMTRQALAGSSPGQGAPGTRPEGSAASPGASLEEGKGSEEAKTVPGGPNPIGKPIIGASG